MVQGAPRTVVKFELTKTIPKLREVCFGCGCTRLVDIDPQWERILVKEKSLPTRAAREQLMRASGA